MGAGRVIIGILFCLAAICMIVVFVTLGLSVDDVTFSGINNLFQAIFLVAIHPYTFLSALDQWSIIAALAAGAFIGGLIAKGAKGGLAVGLITFGILIFCQLAVTWVFNFGNFQLWWNIMDALGSLLLDLALSAGILVGCGLIGGALTGGGE